MVDPPVSDAYPKNTPLWAVVTMTARSLTSDFFTFALYFFNFGLPTFGAILSVQNRLPQCLFGQFCGTRRLRGHHLCPQRLHLSRLMGFIVRLPNPQCYP